MGVEVILNPCGPKNGEIGVDKLSILPLEAEPVILLWCQLTPTNIPHLYPFQEQITRPFSFTGSFQVRQIRAMESHGPTYLSRCEICTRPEEKTRAT
jgi:hypothetical protein